MFSLCDQYVGHYIIDVEIIILGINSMLKRSFSYYGDQIINEFINPIFGSSKYSIKKPFTLLNWTFYITLVINTLITIYNVFNPFCELDWISLNSCTPICNLIKRFVIYDKWSNDSTKKVLNSCKMFKFVVKTWNLFAKVKKWFAKGSIDFVNAIYTNSRPHINSKILYRDTNKSNIL